MDRKSLHRLYGATIPLPTLTDGMVIAIAMDDGPKGICGQAMSVTCPWQHLHFFPDEQAFRDFVETKKLGRGGSREKIVYCVVGSHGTGQMFICDHTQEIAAEVEEQK